MSGQGTQLSSVSLLSTLSYRPNCRFISYFETTSIQPLSSESLRLGHTIQSRAGAQQKNRGAQNACLFSANSAANHCSLCKCNGCHYTMNSVTDWLLLSWPPACVRAASRRPQKPGNTQAESMLSPPHTASTRPCACLALLVCISVPAVVIRTKKGRREKKILGLARTVLY